VPIRQLRWRNAIAPTHEAPMPYTPEQRHELRRHCEL